MCICVKKRGPRSACQPTFSCEIGSLKSYLLEHLNSGTNWLFMWKIIWGPGFYFKNNYEIAYQLAKNTRFELHGL